MPLAAPLMMTTCSVDRILRFSSLIGPALMVSAPDLIQTFGGSLYGDGSTIHSGQSDTSGFETDRSA